MSFAGFTEPFSRIDAVGGGARAATCCPDCGHGEHFHRANTIDQRTKLDAPTPCFYVVGVERMGNRAEGREPTYRYCDCSTVLPLQF